MEKGYFLFFLHAHLPYVRHPDFEEFMEERWLFEAITETYIPLIRVFKNLEKDGIDFKISMSITPPLAEMLSTKDLQEKYVRHMNKLIELAEKEVERTKSENPKFHELAKFYLSDFKDILKIFKDEYNSNILNAFKEYQDKGFLEIVTCNATHGFLPFMQNYPEMVNAQIKVAINNYEKHFGKKPKGIWLAECAYFHGLDRFLSNNNLKFFFAESHALWFGNPAARYGVYRPVITKNDVFVFARDPESGEQVWSATVGYPGDFRYREFYRDIGYDREYDYIKPYIDKSGVRCNTGIKYYKITGKVDLGEKEPYDLNDAMEAVRSHAKDFAYKKKEQIKRLYSEFNGVEPIIVAPYDAELFGHWWYEGPLFIEHLFRELSKIDEIVPVTPSEAIEKIDMVQVVEPAASSWGANGYYEVWLNGANDWIYPHLHEIEERMIELANKYDNPTEIERRILNQMGRELLLAQSSDWAFIMTTGTTVEYAVNRTKIHVKRFFELQDMLVSGKIDKEKLKHYEWLDFIFPELDYKLFSSQR